MSNFAGSPCPSSAGALYADGDGGIFRLIVAFLIFRSAEHIQKLDTVMRTMTLTGVSL